MKKEYPNYVGKMEEIKDNLSSEDINVLEEFNKFCALSSGNDKTIQRRRYALQFRDIAEVPFNKFDRKIIEHIYNLINARKDREICGKNEVIKQLKFFINWKFDNPSLLKGIKVIPQRKGYNTKKINSASLPSNEDIETLISACKNDSKKIAMISLQTELGLRPQELLGLKWRDITFEEDVGEIKIDSNKTKETRILPFKTSVLPILKWKEAYHYSNLKPNDLIFPHPFIRNKQLYRTYLSQLYRTLCKKADIKLIYPYLCRHKKLTEINKKCPSKVASAYGGHSEKTAGIYTHLSEEDIREVILKQIYDIKEPDLKTKKKLEKQLLEHQKEIESLKQFKNRTIENYKVLNEQYKKLIEFFQEINKVKRTVQRDEK